MGEKSREEAGFSSFSGLFSENVSRSRLSAMIWAISLIGFGALFSCIFWNSVDISFYGYLHGSRSKRSPIN
jgi:hypothetical protein